MAKKRILNAGCGLNFNEGTDFIDATDWTKQKNVVAQHNRISPIQRMPRVIKVDMNKDRFPYKDSTFDEVINREVFHYLENLKTSWPNSTGS